MGEQVVTHQGRVKNVDKDKVEVSIIVNSSCASCEIKGSCNLSEMKEKIIEVDQAPSGKYKAGEPVTVIMKQSLGTWAVLLGYFFPFLVVVISLFAFVSAGLDQGLSALLSIGLLIPYYLVLYLTKDYIRKQFSYTIQTD